ncbi:MAG: hypothetical protein QOJ63_2430 [Solirubrobacteraceae bacterium]|jgi:transposase|nr:hypothetical protein [Solirubrobacteraceae bacterium]
MATLQSLSEPQRAILQLLLKQGRSYEQISTLLKSDATAVQARAHEAVAALGPQTPDVGADRRREVADYLLGQQTAAQRAATREYLEDSPDGRAWARAVATELAPLAGDAAPDIPADPPAKVDQAPAKVDQAPAEVDPASEPPDPRAARHAEVQRGSLLGTRIIFVALGLLVALGVILAFGILPGDDKKPTTATVTRTAPKAAADEKPQVIAQAVLRPPSGSSAGASAPTAIVRYASTNRFNLLIAAKKLTPARKGTAYGVWLYTSPSDALFVGFPKGAVTDAGDLDVLADLSPDTRNYREVLITREHVARPKRPGRIVLRGKLVVGAPAQQSQSQTPTQPG